MNKDLRYPIGKYEPKAFSVEQKQKWLQDLKWLPADLEQSVQNLDEAQLLTPYREEGWTVKQLVHHVADSHMNAYMRFKLALTENNPTIKLYEEKEWAMLDDVHKLPVNISFTLLHALHLRWYAAIEDLTEEQWQKTLFHPGQNKEVTIWFLLGMYAWHGKHHVSHIKSLRERMNW